jgi:Uma2 family endonuclease
MGMQMPQPQYYSADMVRDLIDERRPSPRYETVHGELLVTPAPRYAHQEVVVRLIVALRQYMERHAGIGHAMISPADVSFGLPDVLVQPDVFVLAPDEARAQRWTAVTRLLLAVEVLSPSTARHDRFQKRRLYQEQHVPTYWLVDVDARSVEVWTPALHFPHVERDALTWTPEGAREPFVLPLTELFEGIADGEGP